MHNIKKKIYKILINSMYLVKKQLTFKQSKVSLYYRWLSMDPLSVQCSIFKRQKKAENIVKTIIIEKIEVIVK